MTDEKQPVPNYLTVLENYATTFEDTRLVRKAMIETLVALREGKVGATEANAAARLGEVVIDTLHVQLKTVREMGMEAHLPELPGNYIDAEVVDET